MLEFEFSPYSGECQYSHNSSETMSVRKVVRTLEREVVDVRTVTSFASLTGEIRLQKVRHNGIFRKGC